MLSMLSSLGEYLLKKDLIKTEDLERAEAFQKQYAGDRLGTVLIRIGAISEDSLLNILSEMLNMRIIGTHEIPDDPDIFSQTIEKSGIEPDWWFDQQVLVWEKSERQICCITRDPLNHSIVEVLKHAFPDRKIEFFLVQSLELDRVLDMVARSKQTSSSGDNDVRELRELAQEAPVIEFVNKLLSQAIEQNASDVHIEPGEHTMEVRFRIDGILHTRFSQSVGGFPAVSSRIKLISGMDIAERRLPQDGRMGTRLSGESVDIRVSAVPGVHGESIVLRMLPKEGRKLSLEKIGLEEDAHHSFTRWINEPHGIILVTGPTGSGKSTTLYAALETIDNNAKKIITVEDPVEYHMEGITQIQVHSEINYTFARALRSILRQDPDVILIGEIRDKETAEIAVQASLTGHMVISTLHTNDAVSAFTRLIDMGVDPFLVATPVRAVMAQRLVRRLCQLCAEPAEPIPEIQKMAQSLIPKEWEHEEPRWLAPKGCPECQGSGYKGREGIFELVGVTPEMRELILNRGTSDDMRKLAKQQKCRTLWDDGLIKAWQGVTSVEEMLRVTGGMGH